MPFEYLTFSCCFDDQANYRIGGGRKGARGRFSMIEERYGSKARVKKPTRSTQQLLRDLGPDWEKIEIKTKSDRKKRIRSRTKRLKVGLSRDSYLFIHLILAFLYSRDQRAAHLHQLQNQVKRVRSYGGKIWIATSKRI